MNPTERILAALAERGCDPKWNGSGGSSRCPAHDDQNPSLSIKEGDDSKALVFCHAGCTEDAICDALGLSLADLFPSTRPQESPRSGQFRGRRQSTNNGKPPCYATAEHAVAELDKYVQSTLSGQQAGQWTYLGPQGEPVALVIRFDLPTPDGKKQQKTFRPVSKHADGWRVSDPDGPWPLYDLPKVVAAHQIVITEGEKAADAAHAIGLTATTSAHGSKSPGKTDWTPLAGKECLILPDNDEAGHKYAETVAAILAKLTPRLVVKIVELPELPDHGDIVDWIAGHGDAAEPEEMRRKVEALADAAEPTQSEKWPDVRPLPDDLSPVLPYEADMLPATIGSFVSDVAERLQCPPDFPAVAIVAVLAAAIGRRCAIRPCRRDDWTVVPNLWGGVVGRPSILKTPAVKSAMSLLQRLEAEAREQYGAELRDYEKQKTLAGLKKKQAEADAKQALKDGNGDDVLAMLDVAEPKPPVRQRYLTSDATVEKLGELLADNPFGVMTFRDELVGWLSGLEKENQQGARAFYLESWDGTGRFTYDRIGRGTIDIESAVVSIFGGIQPGRLSPYVRSAVNGGLDDDGLIQRFQLLVWPDLPKQWRKVDRWPDTQARRCVFEIIRSLTALDASSSGAELDEFDHAQIPFLRFDEAAQDLFDDWREQLEHRLRSGEEHPAIESHLGKYRSLVPSLALVFHLVEHESGPVGHSAMQLAVRWAEYLESHARRIYSAATAADLGTAKTIWRRIEKGDLADGFNARDIYRRGWTGLDDAETVKAGLELLVYHGYLVEQIEDSERRSGRPPLARYVINPLAKKAGCPTDKSDKSNSVSSVSPHPEQSDDDWGEF